MIAVLSLPFLTGNCFSTAGMTVLTTNSSNFSPSGLKFFIISSIILRSISGVIFSGMGGIPSGMGGIWGRSSMGGGVNAPMDAGVSSAVRCMGCGSL